MAKRKYSKELFNVRRINYQWWVIRISPESSLMEKIEATKTRSQANQYADDYTEKYYVDLYLKQQLDQQKQSR
ncbi:hypothetical protein D7V21_03065 [Acinetobacter guerrae]|uniref:Integrase n=1 Tax=Acinetobacter guerrae TaxID=1843371 RepID=A0A3A8F561_9GAMM|nr:hypothetical protein [Acinetobacter guerrae]RKG35863.1 hypothetical protein D7V21_03065 [Acinetobacter guerrae]